MEVTIRRARKDDVRPLTELAMLSKQSNGYDKAFMAACAEELRVTPALLAEHEYWVAEAETVCGFACLHLDAENRAGEVCSFFVHPDWQRRGIGRLLWAALIRSAQKKGLTRLYLDADPHAEAFYRGLGFCTVGRAPSGSIPGRTLPHMRLDLPG